MRFSVVMAFLFTVGAGQAKEAVVYVAPGGNGKVKFEYPHFTWGIYLDAPEAGVTVFGNLLYNVPVCGMFNHEGRDNTWENNIVVDAPAFRVSSSNYPDLDVRAPFMARLMLGSVCTSKHSGRKAAMPFTAGITRNSIVTPAIRQR